MPPRPSYRPPPALPDDYEIVRQSRGRPVDGGVRARGGVGQGGLEGFQAGDGPVELGAQLRGNVGLLARLVSVEEVFEVHRCFPSSASARAASLRTAPALRPIRCPVSSAPRPSK